MTGWLNGVYSKYHCIAVIDENGGKCLRPAQLRYFNDDNVPLCDECFALLTQMFPWYEK